MRPGVPVESSIDIVFRNSAGACASPIGNEEAAGVALDLRPVSRTPNSLERRDQRFLVVSILSSAGRGGKRADCTFNRICIPRAAGEIIKGEEKAEVSSRVRRSSRVLE